VGNPDGTFRRLSAAALPALLVLGPTLAQDEGGQPADATVSPHPIIASIRIERSDIFERNGAPGGRSLYALANRLHIETREQVIRRELLFQEGEPADPDVLYESERNLRRLRFLHDNTWIETVPREDGRVDVVVHTRDNWTTRPEFSLRREGDETTGRLSFVEGNLLGLGKIAGITFKKEVDRSSGGLLYFDPRLFGTWWTLGASYASRSDGLIYTLDGSRPFYSALTRQAGGGRGAHFSQVTTLQRDGDDAPGFRQHHTDVQVHYGRALRTGYDVVRRVVYRLRIEDDLFDCEPGEACNESAEPLGGAEAPSGVFPLPDDRRFRVIEAEYQRGDIDFAKVNYIDKFDRYEDLNVGGEWAASLGISPTVLGDRHNNLFFGGAYERWFRPTRETYVRARASTSGRFLAGTARNLLTGLDLTHYYLGLPRQTFVLHLGQTWGRNLDGDGQLLLGAESGLRGYDHRRFDGNKKLVLNVEDRVYLVTDWLRLLSIGIAGFADAGYVWRAGEGQDLGDLLADVGVGFRFDATRGGSGVVIRLDYAYPLNRLGQEENPRGIISFASGHAF
jgi:hypothetical protein